MNTIIDNITMMIVIIMVQQIGGYEYKKMGPKTNWAKFDPY